MFSNGRDMTRCLSFARRRVDDDDENDDDSVNAKAMAIPRVFSENSRTKNMTYTKADILLQ